MVHFPTEISMLSNYSNTNNSFFVKRDDLFAFSFGGNKARKGLHFWKEMINEQADAVVTYGSSSSNHCRVIASIASQERMECYVISPQSASEPTYNSQLVELCGANNIVVPVTEVSHTIDTLLKDLKASGKRPYFIPGGGHGKWGTQAYVDCFNEIVSYEAQHNVQFDYIFHASGTGTTQAGLVVGKLLNHHGVQIVGISIARKNPYGAQVVKDSIHEYLDEYDYDVSDEAIENAIIFDDSYVCAGYGYACPEIVATSVKVYRETALALDTTYTAKAWYGMEEYLKIHSITNKNILFIHTGGTPLFFTELAQLHI